MTNVKSTLAVLVMAGSIVACGDGAKADTASSASAAAPGAAAPAAAALTPEEAKLEQDVKAALAKAGYTNLKVSMAKKGTNKAVVNVKGTVPAGKQREAKKIVQDLADVNFYGTMTEIYEEPAK